MGKILIFYISTITAHKSNINSPTPAAYSTSLYLLALVTLHNWEQNIARPHFSKNMAKLYTRQKIEEEKTVLLLLLLSLAFEGLNIPAIDGVGPVDNRPSTD